MHMKLSVRISVVIGVLSLMISTVFSSVNYYFQLQKTTTQYQQLTKQLANNAESTSSIAAYLIDKELGQEVVNDLVANDLITAASITIVGEDTEITAGTHSDSIDLINLPLMDPFADEEVIGSIQLTPNIAFIEAQAQNVSLQNAFLLLALSIIIAISVGYYVRLKLTLPVKELSQALGLIDTSQPLQMSPIDIGYNEKDEIGALSEKTNILIQALKKQFLSERQLRESTEELQRRFRLLFEHATAGIALLSHDGVVKIGNSAFHQLFGKNVSEQNFASLFESPMLVSKQLKKLYKGTLESQVDIDLVLLGENDKCYVHCLFSTIHDVRRHDRDNTEQMIEVIMYDITYRKQREQKARYEADHDALTGLLNRRSGTKKLSTLLAQQQQDKTDLFALMMVDLDKFKPINDTYGHDIGDLVLNTISQRISSLSTQFESLTIRWGGDEFVIGVRVPDKLAIQSYTEELIENVSSPIEANSTLNVQVGASVGVVVISKQQCKNIDSLIGRADELMYDTKQQWAKRYTIVDFA